ncbi:membrane protein [Neosynechococcus sphagnicola sy1]|uniref:Membrane protein n=1 Tax=Neosynechococcus sphagnicola sy1 TaxID=1497020 RepID=A0A098TI56_9CYAN|nr:membrane protein [Neosynechococcus sphagnicola sy1]
MPWLDVGAIAAWGGLLLTYWLTGKLNLLIHPQYTWLAISGGMGMLLISAWKAWELLRSQGLKTAGATSAVSHITLFPPGWSSTLLLITALLGFLISPRVFTSQTAFHRGVTDSLALTRTHPQAFHSAVKPEERSLIDWVRTLNVYPEPDAYTGQPVKVQGFVIHAPELPDNYLLISRFVITCCAADVYPVSLPVKLTQSRRYYPPDIWLEIEGRMITEVLSGQRKLTIQPQKLTGIPEPKNPYEY